MSPDHISSFNSPSGPMTTYLPQSIRRLLQEPSEESVVAVMQASMLIARHRLNPSEEVLVQYDELLNRYPFLVSEYNGENVVMAIARELERNAEWNIYSFANASNAVELMHQYA